jgi:glycopeptide antibiotics resistance protein
LRPRAAFGLTLTAYLLFVAAVVTLAPFRFADTPVFALTWRTSAEDFVLNFLMFVPLGFSLRLATGGAPSWCVGAALFGVAASGAIETAQAWLPGRCPSLIDVGTNATGCWFGALIHDEIRRRSDARLAGALALELPLMGLFYLLVPLVWANGLAAAGEEARLWFSLLPGAIGSIVLASVWVHRLRGKAALSAWTLSAIAFAWFVVASLPTMRIGKRFVLGCALVVALLVRLQTWLPALHRADGRRFEAPTLRRVAPLFASYLLLLAVWPWSGETVGWRGGIGLIDLADVPDRTPVLRLIEWIAVFTVGGYMLAEARGRRDERDGAAGLVVLLAAATAAAALEGLRGVHPRYAASALHAGRVRRGRLQAAVGVRALAARAGHFRSSRSHPASRASPPNGVTAPSARTSVNASA